MGSLQMAVFCTFHVTETALLFVDTGEIVNLGSGATQAINDTKK